LLEQVTRVTQELRVQQALKEMQDHKAFKAKQVHRVQLELKGPKVLKD
jgi:hypothetical protein